MQREDLQRSYDRSAERYDQVFWPLQKHKFAAVLSACPLAEDARILDLGAGTGLLGRIVRSRFVALDLSRGMLEKAPPHLYRVQADSDALPFAGASFEAVFSFTSLLHVPHIERSLAEVRRVLCPEGLFALTLLKQDRYAALESQLQSEGLVPFRELSCGQDFALLCRAPAS